MHPGADGSTTAAVEDSRAQKIAALVAQLTSLRQEIYERSRHQHQIMGFQVTSVATIVGFVAAGRVSPLFLTVLVFTSSGFALFWLDHHKQIARLGVHIAVDVEEQVNAILDAEVLRWESSDFPQHRSSRFIKFVFRSAVIVIFLFPPAAALLVVATSFNVFSQPWWMEALWGTGLIALSYVTAVTYFMLWRYRAQLREGLPIGWRTDVAERDPEGEPNPAETAETPESFS